MNDAHETDGWVPQYERDAAALQAASQFVRAVGDVRRNITIVHARDLARWLADSPEVLDGDDELPGHILAAADALEDLPRAVLSYEFPVDYEGGTAQFIADADRLFRSVTRRLGLLAIHPEADRVT